MTAKDELPEAKTARVADALKKNAQAADEVRQATDDLAVIHAVLETKVTGDADDADVRRAVQEAGKVEDRLARTADKLDDVNATLKRDVGR